jgi:hypothetical protein
VVDIPAESIIPNPLIMAAESAQELVQLDSFHNVFSLYGKIAVVTGGSRGLGLSAASGYVYFAVSPPSAMTVLNSFVVG